MIKNTFSLVFLLVVIFVSFGQEERTYSDEELTKYASVMVWAEMQKGEMTSIYNGWINKNEDLDAPRFLAIKKTKNDSVKLQELNATAIELAAYDKILTDYDSMTASFKETYVTKIKEDIGAGLYNALKKELKANEAIKERYEAIVAGLKQETDSELED